MWRCRNPRRARAALDGVTLEIGEELGGRLIPVIDDGERAVTDRVQIVRHVRVDELG